MFAEVSHTRVATLVVAGLAHELGAVLLVQMLAGELFYQFLLVIFLERLVDVSWLLGLIFSVHLLEVVKLNRSD